MAKKKNKSSQNQKVPISFNVHSISLVKKEINPPTEYVPVSSKRYSYSLKIDFKIFEESKDIRIVVMYSFKLDGQTILYIEVENDYRFLNLEEIIGNGNFKDQTFFDFLVDFSIDHARGIQSIVIVDTTIDKLYMPQINSVKASAATRH